MRWVFNNQVPFVGRNLNQLCAPLRTLHASQETHGCVHRLLFLIIGAIISVLFVCDIVLGRRTTSHEV